MAFSQKLSAVQTLYPVVTSNYVPGLRLEFARFYGETGHFKLDFSIENSNFSQFFPSGIHIHTFSHNSEKKNSFHRHFKCQKHRFYLKNMRDDSCLHFRTGVSNPDQGKCITLELYITFKLWAGEDTVF